MNLFKTKGNSGDCGEVVIIGENFVSSLKGAADVLS